MQKGCHTKLELQFSGCKHQLASDDTAHRDALIQQTQAIAAANRGQERKEYEQQHQTQQPLTHYQSDDDLFCNNYINGDESIYDNQNGISNSDDEIEPYAIITQNNLGYSS
ncbi:hypothetical protein HK100_008965 [Physocladia obscura]|uniref:Uncharacterized protein n=1 Tax=Physocladia obscura TaxID=109957 RepID=A0AAD5SMA9_9FUNG|nr:hypothetical protein HK100_008965 [Physocladia obscura]